MENSLWDYAMRNIEDTLNKVLEVKMSNKVRVELGQYMAVIAANAFRAGYHARAREGGVEVLEKDFDRNSELLTDVVWRIQQTAK